MKTKPSPSNRDNPSPWGTVAVVGVGLIGGSIGLALADRRLAERVIGVGRNPASLKKAQELGAIDEFTTDLAEGVAAADLIVICTPVDQIAPQALEAAAHCPAGALVTDAGSTKQSIVAAVERGLKKLPAGGRARFVGGHPLAGGEKSGPEFARADLFQGRATVVTPARQTPAADAQTICEFWSSLGSTVLTMSPAAHDKALASTSHLPHLLAAAIAGSTAREDLPLVAGGWRDTTRIAAGDAILWRQILLDNGDHVLKSLARFEKTLSALREAISRRDGARLEMLLQRAAELRGAVESDPKNA